jgi:hypothetical protein
MDEPENPEISAPRKRRYRGLKITLLSLFLLLVASFAVIFFGFNYFGQRFLRNYLQEKIRISSKGLYRADFKDVRVNILTGKVEIDSFELIPDTLRYRQLKAEGRMARSLYRISFSSLFIDRVRFRQIYADRRINFRQLVIDRPKISIVGFPDTATAKRSRWRVIYEDLYPAVSGVFNDFHIDSVKVSHGLFLTSFIAKTGKETTGVYEFSTLLTDVSVNPFSYYNRERVFYSKDVGLVVHNFESELADSLYSIKAEEIGFSLTKSTLYGKKVSLTPNFHSKRIREVHSGDLFRVDLPEFSIRGIDLYQAMTGREVELSSVNLTNLIMRVYHNAPPPGTAVKRKTKKKITLAGLYTVVAKALRFISIDTLSLKNGSIEFFGKMTDARPELRIGAFNLELSQFRLDSLTYLDPSRIFYSRSIELDLQRISLYLRDGIHCVNATAVSFSTQKGTIDVREASIFPDRKKNQLLQSTRHNTMLVNLPRLRFTGIDLKKVFNRRILDFNQLIIDEPEVNYTRYRPPKNTDPRFKKPVDFFQSENEEVVYDLLKKYLWVVKGNEINLSHGHVKYSADRYGTEVPLANSSFDLTMHQFLIDSVHGMNEQGYFYSQDFDLDLQSVSLVSPDSLKYMQAGNVRVITHDSLIEADNIRIYKSADPQVFNSRIKRKHPMTVEFSLKKLRLTGLNHKKLFLEKILRANQIIMESPALLLKTGSRLRPSGPPEESDQMKSETFVHTVEIGRCLVKKGSFSYDGEEDRKASYFNLKDIEFAVMNAIVHIPDKGLNNGIIKFDSLLLKVFPFRAVIADSTYALEARSFEVHSYPADIILKGIKVTPLKTWSELNGKKNLVTIAIPELRFNGFYFDKAIFDNQWQMTDILVDHPKVVFETKEALPNAGNTGHIDPGSILKVPPVMNSVAIDHIRVTSAQFELIAHKAGKTVSTPVNDLMINISGFKVDSTTRSDPAGTPLFNADDITLSAAGRSWHTPDSMYTIAIGRVGLSTASSAAYIDSIKVTPNYSMHDFSRKLGYQSDRIMLQIPRVNLTQIDLRKLISDREFRAEKVSLEGLNFESYRDKRVPFPDWQRPPMPTQVVSSIKFPLCIDTVVLTNGFATYEEQLGDEPGRIFFDRLNAMVTGLSNVTKPLIPPGSDSNSLDLYGTTRLMGKAPMEIRMNFQKGHPRDTFNVHATIGELDLTTINPMLSKLVPASIEHGIAPNTEIVQINGNKTSAEGVMNFKYNNLAIRLHQTKPGTWNMIEQSLLSELVNLLLADNNPNDDGKMKQGVIYFERDTTKGFFNFVWKSVLSGIKSSVGFNSKTQKEMIKQRKNLKK